LIEVDKVFRYNRSNRRVLLTGTPSIDQTMTLIVGDETSFRALKIDRYWNEQEFTITSIDSPIPLPPGMVSSIILGDGKVIPFLDPMALSMEMDSHEEDRHDSDDDLQTTNISTTKTILIVDDSINVRRYLGLTLTKAGYLVEEAKDGQEAVDKLLGGLGVQGVICDLEMPRLDGYGVLEEIKERPEFVDLPIAMLTSRSNEKHRKLALNLGASAYFSKPYNEQELLSTLHQLLQSSNNTVKPEELPSQR
ncbi:MAG: response regulator, partial [Cyanobacteria bacterium J06600_6]